jgi:hypothetical protein
MEPWLGWTAVLRAKWVDQQQQALHSTVLPQRQKCRATNWIPLVKRVVSNFPPK